MRSTAIVVIVLAFVTVSIATKNLENKTFLATNEWQDIQEGQPIPAGLHVRINLETGKKEAKLLDEKDDGGVAALATLPDNADNTSETPPKRDLKISNKLTEALKNLPKDGLSLEYSPDKLEKIKKDYKTYKEIKESYDDMRLNFKTDAEVLTQLIGEYRNLSKSELELTPQSKITAQQRILDNFNYLLHQIDNALWFIDEGGLEQVLLPLVVNQTHVGLRVQAMRVLGALTQNNPKAQIKVFERNFGSHLAQILISSTNTDELSTSLYAFGSLLRKFPHAQQRILSTSGTQALIAVLAKECELKIKAKAVTIISDVILEKQQVISASVEGDALAAAQYAELNFPEWLQTHAYCDTMDALLSNTLYELLEQPDVTEYFVQALHSTHNFCAALWSQSPQLRHALLTVKNRYMHSGEEYRLEVATQMAQLIEKLYAVSDVPHDEL